MPLGQKQNRARGLVPSNLWGAGFHPTRPQNVTKGPHPNALSERDFVALVDFLIKTLRCGTVETVPFQSNEFSAPVKSTLIFGRLRHA
jgi:hypothetical protein